MRKIIYILITLCLTSCISTKLTIKNIDNSAVRPEFKNDRYILTTYSTDDKYGTDADFPINIGVLTDANEEVKVGHFFNSITGKNGEKVIYQKQDTCCPFPTKNNTMGAGTLSIYEYTIEGTSKKGKLYFNLYERGKMECPKGFSIKPSS